jgi:hypothetical protein
MLGIGTQILIGLVSTTAATGLTTVGNIFLTNGIQQGMIEANQRKQQKINQPNNNHHNNTNKH